MRGGCKSKRKAVEMSVLLIRFSKINTEWTAVERGAIEIAAGGHGGFFIFKFTKAKTFWATCFVIVH